MTQKELLSYTDKKRFRVFFGDFDEVLSVTNLYDTQSNSFSKFVKKNSARTLDTELSKIFRDIFPVYTENKMLCFEYIQYHLDDSLFTPEECRNRGISYASTLRITTHTYSLYENVSFEDQISNLQDVCLLNFPLMTEKGTFIINGTERAVVCQLHKSPGLFFEAEKVKSSSIISKFIYVARIIPVRGTWLDIEFDNKNCIFAKIDKKKKFPITLMLKALDVDCESILNLFSKIKVSSVNEELINSILAHDIKNKQNEIIFYANTKITDEILETLKKEKIKFVKTSHFLNSYILNTLNLDRSVNQEEAVLEIYKIMRPGEPTGNTANIFFKQLFFTNEKYDLSLVGRSKLNERLKINETNETFLTKNDIIFTLKKLIEIKEEKDHVDDIDNLGNKRVKAIGEILENLFKVGLLRIKKSMSEKLAKSEQDDNIKPHDILNLKYISIAIKEFFFTSQLSQFMDQTNPLSEITHKRRLSSLGPGGLTRERAGFEVRDVHNTHYGRICPIETPEGPNIGLINSLAIYARTNDFGFIETPYIKVKDKKITDEIEYLTAPGESLFVIAQANAKINKKTKEFVDEKVSCRFKNEFVLASVDKIQYMDVSPKQMVSIATSLIPFLEHDDANRALMGSNMQRQAVPLLIAEKPLVGTGMEKIVASNISASVIVKRSGTVEKVDSFRIIIRSLELYSEDDDYGIDVYDLIKYSRSNQNTCINQRPIVKVGDFVKKGDIIADGSCTDLGELALGHNMLTAFMTWNGYNFEDSVILSESVIKENKLASIHIEEYLCISRDTKTGPEEITKDIPGLDEFSLRNLDESGIIFVGTDVEQGDILVGKITNKADINQTPEEKLLQAIFGEKASEIDDTSLRVPIGVKGTVINVQVFTRYGVKKNKRAKEIEEEKLDKAKKNITEEFVAAKQRIIYEIEDLVREYSKEYIVDFSISQILESDDKQYRALNIKHPILRFDIYKRKSKIERARIDYSRKLHDEDYKIRRSENLPPGVLRIVKVSIAAKKPIQIGDKISGRHGNKGVVSTIVPVEDMPYLEDGTMVEIILNPLGVPSRMNIGQVLETHLGWAAKELGKKIKKFSINKSREELKDFIKKLYNIKKINNNLDLLSEEDFDIFVKNLENGVPIATPIFDGIKEIEIKNLLKMADLPESGKTILYDGRSGLPFDNKITVGYQYIMKLNHLVDDKIHARSTGTYSLVSQQPLGGRAQFGGQRFGEMEVWALEAYGAAYTLQEMLTVKSDDVLGRAKIYKNIIDNKSETESGVPEAFNVLLKEILSMCINIETDKE